MIHDDKNIGIHKKYIVKEMRIMIYSLFLESYKTVTLECMAEQFGISVGFLDT
jgi:26S proteasome regulatory subunit N7